ncbi:MAG TPA: hypothetical protein VK975_01995 [Acidimicrobiales bacterium]|nr:hypothetical protein [Acidimicrobiales bacterium]
MRLTAAPSLEPPVVIVPLHREVATGTLASILRRNHIRVGALEDLR